MSAPNPKEGVIAGAKVEVQNAIAQMRKVLDSGAFPVDSQEFKDLHQAYGKLSKAFGNQESNELGTAGLKLAASALSPKGLGGIMPQGPGPMPIGGM